MKKREPMTQATLAERLSEEATGLIYEMLAMLQEVRRMQSEGLDPESSPELAAALRKLEETSSQAEAKGRAAARANRRSKWRVVNGK